MKVRVTKKGVHRKDNDGKDVPVAVDTVLDLGPTEEIPVHLVNKCVPVGKEAMEDQTGDEDEDKDAVVNPADGGKKAKAK